MTEDTQPETEPDDVEQAVNQAEEFHQIIDNAKTWSRQTATEIRVQAENRDDQEETENLQKVADIIDTVGNRIEQGDNNRARQP